MSGTSLDLSPFADRLSALALAAVLPPPPVVVQKRLAFEARALVEEILAGAGEGPGAPHSEWGGWRRGDHLELSGTAVAISASVAGGGVSAIEVCHDSGIRYRLDFTAEATRQVEDRSGGGWADFLGRARRKLAPPAPEPAESPMLRVGISRGEVEVSAHVFPLEGGAGRPAPGRREEPPTEKLIGDVVQPTGGVADRGADGHDEAELGPDHEGVDPTPSGGAPPPGANGPPGSRCQPPPVAVNPPPGMARKRDLGDVSEPGRWFILRDGEQVGPMVESHLKELLTRGEISRRDQVWSEVDPRWVVADDVPGLVPDSAPPGPDVPAASPAEGVAVALDPVGESTDVGRVDIAQRLTIGRHRSNDLVIEEQVVSAQHAVIEVDGLGLRLTDLTSTNGTFVNGDRIRQTVQLEPGDELRIGTKRFLVVIAGSPFSPSAVQATSPVEVPGTVSEAGPEPCRRCGREITGRGPFCVACGTEAGSMRLPMEEVMAHGPRAEKCSRCGHDLSGRHRFCTRCGEPTDPVDRARPKFCTQCGTALEASDRFCGGCGRRVPG